MKYSPGSDKRPAVLWLVTTRVAEKNLPHPDTRLLGGIPLLAWRIQRAIVCRTALSALAGKHIQKSVATGRLLGAPPCGDKIWLNTDNKDCAEAALRFGAEVPFLYPQHRRVETISAVDVCLHAMQVATNAGLHFDMIGLLPVTAPFVRAESLRTALTMLQNYPEALGAVAVRRVHPASRFVQPQSPWLDVVASRMSCLDEPPQQATPAEITPCDGFYISRWQAVLDERALFTQKTLTVPLEHPETVTIATDFDFAVGELLLEKGHVSAPVTVALESAPLP